MLRRSFNITSLALVLLLYWFCSHALAGSPLGIGTAEPTLSLPVGGALGRFLFWINQQQQIFYRALTEALEAMRSDPWNLRGLILISFTYGIFHAAGPGHGKAVISSYMIANEATLKRGIVISFLAAFLQGCSALLVVVVAYLVLRGTSVSMSDATNFLETLSFALVMIMGLWLLIRKITSLVQQKKRVSNKNRAVSASGLFCEEISFAQNLSNEEACIDCGRLHIPAPDQLGGEQFSLKEAVAAIAAVGLRPCTGAIIVLTFSLLNGLFLGGFLSVLFMSIGTAMTVSALATIAVGTKASVVQLARFAYIGSIVGHILELVGAFAVFLFGALLTLASINPFALVAFIRLI